MTTLRSRSLSASVTLALLAGVASASLPPLESGDPTVSVSYEDGQVTMRDVLDGTPLLMPKGMAFFEPATNGLTPTVTFQAQPTGFDMLFTFRNNFAEPRPLGTIVINTITLGQYSTTPDFRFSGQDRELDILDPPAWTYNYPGLIYSPAAVIKNDAHAIGVSLQYPILEYEHDVSVSYRTRGGRFALGEGGQGWQIRFNLSNNAPGALSLYESATVPPGGTREYVVSVRATRQVQEWIRTMLPYRTFFQSTYGGPQYVRRRDPVRVNVVSATQNITAENPYGFDFRRADRNGFRSTVEFLLGIPDYSRYMVWATSGVYSGELNYPFQFTSRWAEDSELMSALDPRYGFPRLFIEGRDLGLWWGNSGQFTRVWNPTELEGFNPNNPSHVEAAFHEIDMAVAAGARTIGMDAFSHRVIREWDGYRWLQRLRERYPGVKFVVEPKANDLYHTLAAGYFRGYEIPDSATDPSDVHALDSPHYLADFLVPGHETWAMMRWEMYMDFFGVPATEDKMREDIYDAAAKGYVPLVATGVDIDPALAVAAESWTYTVPEDLRQEATNQNLIGPPPRFTGGGRNDRSRNTNRGARGSQILRRYTGGQSNRTPETSGGTRIVTSISADRTINSGGGGGALLADGGDGN
ncbi:MAG: hypothetical protein IT439_12000 [Phycisphaerales bacterium]|nr:hypothetical protein [Phycisphaerales bacterium]